MLSFTAKSPDEGLTRSYHNARLQATLRCRICGGRGHSAP